MIKEATYSDLHDIAVCHTRAFPDSFTTRLGVSFVRSMLGWYLSDDKKFLLYYSDGSQCVGYCGAYINDGTSATGSTSGMIQHAFSDAIKSLVKKPWLLFHREMRKNYKMIFRNVLRKLGLLKKKSKPETKPVPKKPSKIVVGIVGIGVIPEAQGTGIGSQLLQAFEKTVREKGFENVNLSVKKDNEKAIRAYTRNGWHVSGRVGVDFVMEKQLTTV